MNKCCILKKRNSRCVKCLCDSLTELTHSTCKLAVLHNGSRRQTRLIVLITVSPLQIPYTKVPPACDETINKARFLDWKRSSGWLKSWETKCQSLTRVLLRTPITQMIFFNQEIQYDRWTRKIRQQDILAVIWFHVLLKLTPFVKI